MLGRGGGSRGPQRPCLGGTTAEVSSRPGTLPALLTPSRTRRCGMLDERAQAPPARPLPAPEAAAYPDAVVPDPTHWEEILHQRACSLDLAGSDWYMHHPKVITKGSWKGAGGNQWATPPGWGHCEVVTTRHCSGFLRLPPCRSHSPPGHRHSLSSLQQPLLNLKRKALLHPEMDEALSRTELKDTPASGWNPFSRES